MDVDIKGMRRDLRKAYEQMGRKILNVTIGGTEDPSVLLDPVRELYERVVCLVTAEAITEEKA